MDNFWNRHNLIYRISTSLLIILHLVTFGPIKDVLAFTAQSTTYKLSSGALNEGGKSRTALTTKLRQDALGEACAGKAQSISYILNSGFIPTIQADSPILIQKIPYQTWLMNSSKDNAFDLDNYFLSPEGYPLSFTVSGNSQINVNIDPVTHLVSFSQPEDWYGVEKVYFYATDTENNTAQSNKVVLQVENTAGPDKPVIVDIQVEPALIKEGDLVKITVKALDLDNEDLTFSYNNLFTEIQRWKEGSLWISEATWQTGFNSKGHYNIQVTVTDTTGLTDTDNVLINVGNFNHPPVLEPIPDVTANEGDLVVVTPHATDSDNDAITFYYTSPLDSTGKWLTTYDDAGTHTATVIASDGIDTVSCNVTIIINNTNRAPQASLTLSKYTVKPNEEITITISATEPDGDSMTFSLKKDSQEIASGTITDIYTTTTSFAATGDHTIEATVTDSGGKSATDTKGVDVADPNANRDYINPVMGDFNGDALSDLGLHNSQTGTWEICISDVGVFRNAVDWLTNFGTSKDWWPVGGDLNGDGKTDIAIYNNTTGELKVALSSGSSFSASGTWLTAFFASYSWQPLTGNFNGDKYTDFALYNKDTGEVKVALGTGSGFGSFTTWINSFGNDYIALGGDFNGDSLTDLCLFRKSSGEFKVAFSDSKAFVDGSTMISSFATDKDCIISDFNNDGLADIGYWDKSNFNWYYATSTGAAFINKGTWLNFGASSDESATTGDFNGDGVTDAACFDRDQIGINRWTVGLSTDKPTDLLVEIDNGIGGKTQVTYTYAAKSDNDLLPFPVYVASTISLVNSFPADRAATYTQNFAFSGGYYDAGEREFRGFAKVRVTDPITNNYTETYFYQGKPGQDGALKGQIEKIIACDGNGRKISETLNTYEVRKAGPETRFLGFPALVEQTTTIWEENATYITTKDKYTYDNIGNILEENDEGDTSKLGDEKSTATTYAQAYEDGFNRPTETVLKDKDANVISKRNFEYDTKGNLIKETAWLNTQDEQPITQYTYDSFGNLTLTTNALGAVVTTEFETTFYTYPQKVTNSLGHTIQYIYEPKFGVVTSIIDANANTSTTTYDSLGRVTQVKNALNQITTTYSYPDFNTMVTTQLNLTKTNYIDGLGRKYKTTSSGEDGSLSRDTVTEVFYNNRGLVSAESLLHYIDEDPNQISYVRYEYDIRGRLKKTISDFPGTLKDAESTVNYINPLYTETTDPQGHKKGTLKDVYGNIIEVTEFTQGGVYKTKYEYDNQNNLIKTIDSQGNITQIFYDSLGRKLKMLDPDMGTWTYEYDLIGNLIKQTDAKAQVLTFEYDALNRLTSKLANSQTLVTYQYDDASKENCIGRLSKITDQSGSTEFFYDKLGREIKSIKTVDSNSYTIERTYDVLDRLISLKYPDGEIVNYSYDTNSGLLERVAGTNTYVQDITYNAQGQIKIIGYGNGTQTNYTYGQDLRLSRILTQGLSTLQDLNYIFDKNGNLTTLTDNLRSNIRSFEYDDLDRLTYAQNLPSPEGGYTNFSFQYDSIGNMTYKSDVGVMSYGVGAGPHALTSAGGYTYQYDANGNMISGKNKTMKYDAENRLLEVNELGIITMFTYDGDGGRVKKNSTNSITQQTQETLYIGSLFEKDSSGNTTKHIFAGANRICTKGLSPQGTDPTYSYYHSDHLGSSNVITDATGQQVQYCEYTPYGTLARNEGTDLVKHKFTGKELDNTGLYFYGARYYDPQLGRFITADTIVQSPYDPQSLNRYSYCRNNPINYVDPTGHFFWFAAIAFVAACAVIGAVASVAIAGATGQLTSWTAFWAAFSSGATAGAIWGVGSFIPGAGSILGGILIGSVAGAAAGAVGSSVSGAFSWGSVGLGAAFGGALGGFGNSAAGRALGRGVGKAIGKLPYGQHIQNIGRVIGNKMSQLYQAAKGTSGSSSGALSVKGKSVSGDSEQIDRIVIRKSASELGPAKVGDKIYRVWGDGSGPEGRSWTRTNPETVPNFRAEAGLPPENTGRFVSEGRLVDTTGVTTKAAEPIYGNPGGLDEVVIPDPNNQIQIERVSGANPEY